MYAPLFYLLNLLFFVWCTPYEPLCFVLEKRGQMTTVLSISTRSLSLVEGVFSATYIVQEYSNPTFFVLECFLLSDRFLLDRAKELELDQLHAIEEVEGAKDKLTDGKVKVDYATGKVCVLSYFGIVHMCHVCCAGCRFGVRSHFCRRHRRHPCFAR